MVFAETSINLPEPPPQDSTANLDKSAVHLILDNYGTPKRSEVKKWFAKHARYQLDFTPTSTSRLNQIDRWFAEITRKRIRRGTFRSVGELEQAIRAYI